MGFLACFSSLIQYISDLRINTGTMVSQIVQAFHRLGVSLKMASICFVVGFFGQTRDDKNVEKFFRIRSSYISNLIKDTETIIFREKQQ